jgi:HK97 gp10 family phage protein
VIQATLVSRIPEIVASLPGEVSDALGEGAELIAEQAKERVPVDEGTLRDAIHTEEVEGGWSVVAGNEQDAFYGHIIEHGGAHLAPRPFLTPAAESAWDDVLQLVEDALEDL